MDKNSIAESIDKGVGRFSAEASGLVEDAIPLFDLSAYPEEQHEIIKECNRRIDEANGKYRIARFREDMFAKGLKAGMYFCTFDRDENMLGFEFNDETRQMLGYDGLEDLPNEFDITREDLENKLSYLKTALRKIVLDNDPEVRITMSFGGAFGTELVNNLIETADKALYEAKKCGIPIR